MPHEQHVMCSVDSCHYWKTGNHCGADSIMVTADSMAASQPDTVDARQAASMPATPAQHCMETCCKTFTCKDSGKEYQDQIIKT